MFVDISKIKIRAGKGGDGSVHFHREKYVAAGGPDGGDGGKGGDVVFQVDQNLSTLIDFKYKTKYAAEDGQPGAGKNCFGRTARTSSSRCRWALSSRTPIPDASWRICPPWSR